MKKASILLSTVITLVSLLMPFSISANQSLPSPFLGININIIDTETYQRITSISTSELTINSTGANSFQCTNYGSTGCGQYRFTNYTGQGAGTFAPLTFQVVPNLSSVNVNSNLYSNYIYEYEFILDNYYVGYVNLTINNTSDNYYVNGTSFKVNKNVSNLTITVNNYELNLLDSNKTQWFFPIESYSYINHFYTNSFEQVGISQYDNYMYPIFLNDTSKYLARYTYDGNGLIVIFGMYSSSISSVSTFNSNSSYNSNYTLVSFDTIYAATGFRMVKLTFNNNGSGRNLNLVFNQAIKIVPVYIGTTSDSYLSTDFALRYGLTNELLSNLNIIANGTASSNSSSSGLNSANNEFNSTVGDYNNLESSFNNDFNNNLEAINPNDNGLSLMGSKFLQSANWVKVQFDRMTNNTPFGSVIGFSLVLGLGLLIIGRVFG